ncbi:MAG: flagellar type III secretion system pore protein FliP [Planctomycetota bacterium]
MTRLLFCILTVVIGFVAPASAQVDSDDSGLEPPPPLEQPWGEFEGATPPSEPGPLGSAMPSADPTLRLPDLTDRENLAPTLQIIVLLTVLSLAPALLVLCTSFTRIIIVLSLLRQAMGAPTLPPNQVLTGLALIMTMCVMGPTIGKVHNEAIAPYMAGELTQAEAWERGTGPVREFMIAQIQAAGNDSTVLTFQQFSGNEPPETWGDVSTATLVPAFALSELKVGFLMGFKVYLPFLVIDMIISAVLISMGMMMLPPVLISLPFKLLLFVLVDGWHLVVASLMGSFALTG